MPNASELSRLRTEVGEIVTRHASRSTINFRRYASDPVGFLRHVLHCEPWSKQEQIAALVRDNSKVAIVSANSVGKDWLIARLTLWWVYARGGLAILTSVTDRQARQISMREVRRAFLGASDLPGELFQMELRVSDTSGIIAFTSDNADRLVGFHHPRLLLALSEAQGLEAQVFEAAFACATAEGNRIVAYGNPTRPNGTFYNAANSESWASVTIRADEHPNIVNGREEIPGGPSLSWIESMREEYGEASSIFRARVLAQWPEESVEGLIKRQWLNDSSARHESSRGGEGTVVLGVDVARYGADQSCVAVCRGRRVEELIRWRGASTTDSAERVIAIAQRLQKPRIIVDDTGVGGGVTDTLRARGYHVTAFNGGASASQRFLNLRAASHWRFRELLERGEVDLPRDSQLMEEALALEWQLAPSGGIQILSKDSVRKTLGRSPDSLDSVVMAVWLSMRPERRPMPSYSYFSWS